MNIKYVSEQHKPQFENKQTHFEYCPFCGAIHELEHKQFNNIICVCGAKRYANTRQWLDRKTGTVI